MNFTIRQGLDISLKGSPRQVIEGGRKVSSVALLGRDFPDIRPKMLVNPEQKVAVGQSLFCDRSRPEIVITSPTAGLVFSIERNHRSSFEAIIIHCEGDDAVAFDTSGEVRKTLLKCGLWTALKTRPLGRIPDSDAGAEAILVTAMDTNPAAADPRVVLQGDAWDDFERGLGVLASLNAGPVFVCQAPGAPLARRQGENTHNATFRGRHPAGLPGTHLDRLGLAGKPIWQIGYQDVIAIGHLFLAGQLSTERIIALAGPMVRDPRLVRTRRGANLKELLKDEMPQGGARVISGSVLSGKPSGFLGHYHTQVCVLQAAPHKTMFSSFSRLRTRTPTPLLATEAFEKVLPQDILPVPLMRALSVGDWDTAQRLGAADLLDEDVALLSYLCPSGNDYGALLRLALDDLAEVAG